MTGEQVWGIVRTILAAAGGYLVAKGYIDNTTMVSILGGLGTVFIGAWSVWSKTKTA